MTEILDKEDMEKTDGHIVSVIIPTLNEERALPDTTSTQNSSFDR